MLLKHVHQLIQTKGFDIINIDSVIVAQAPKLKPFIGAIQAQLEKALSLETGTVSVKATTSETLGFEGRKEGMSAHSVVLLKAI